MWETSSTVMVSPEFFIRQLADLKLKPETEKKVRQKKNRQIKIAPILDCLLLKIFSSIRLDSFLYFITQIIQGTAGLLTFGCFLITIGFMNCKLFCL